MKYFINLSAGLLQSQHEGEIIYIRSSHIESKAWDRLFYTFPDNLLFAIARGLDCCIVDCSSNGIGKIIKSVPIFKHILNRLWLGELNYKGLDKAYMERIYKMLSRETKAKLRYYKKFNPSIISLTGISIHVDKEYAL